MDQPFYEIKAIAPQSIHKKNCKKKVINLSESHHFYLQTSYHFCVLTVICMKLHYRIGKPLTLKIILYSSHCLQDLYSKTIALNPQHTVSLSSYTKII